MVRGLPGRTRVVAGVCLALLACLVAATFLVHLLPTRFAEVTWSDDGRRLGLPRVALYLTLAGLAVAPAVILAGASRSIPLLFIGAGLVQLYAVLFTAFVGGKAYWLAALTWLLPVLAATSPASTWGRRGRLVATTALCALAAWHTYRVTPWSAGGRPPAWSWLAILFLWRRWRCRGCRGGSASAARCCSPPASTAPSSRSGCGPARRPWRAGSCCR